MARLLLRARGVASEAVISIALGNGEARLYWRLNSDPDLPMVGRLRSVVILHHPGGRGRAICAITFKNKTNPWGDGPHGYSLRDPVTCERCGTSFDVRRSSIIYDQPKSGSHKMKRRGLRIIR